MAAERLRPPSGPARAAALRGRMEQKPPKTKAPKAPDDRAARLKAALKANLARRKAQARARKGGEEKN